MGRLGADPASLRRLASKLDSASEDLDGDALLIGKRTRSVAWHGQDAQRHLAEWDSVHRPALRDVSQALAAAARQLRAEAKDQEAASDGSAGSGSAAGTGTGAGPGAPGGMQPISDTRGGDDGFPGPATWVGMATGVASLVGALPEAALMGEARAAQRMAAAAGDVLQESTLLTEVPTLEFLTGRVGQVLGTASRVLGVADLAYNAWNLIDGVQEGDGGQIADGVIGSGLAVAGMIVGAGTPVGWAVLGAGAVWTGLGFLSSHLGYENTSDMLWDGITWVGDGVADLATGAWHGVEDAADAVAHAGQEFLEGAGDVFDTIGGWFD